MRDLSAPLRRSGDRCGQQRIARARVPHGLHMCAAQHTAPRRRLTLERAQHRTMCGRLRWWRAPRQPAHGGVCAAAAGDGGRQSAQGGAGALQLRVRRRGGTAVIGGGAAFRRGEVCARRRRRSGPADAARRRQAKIPAAAHAEARLVLFCTAGLRLLPQSQQDTLLGTLRARLPGLTSLTIVDPVCWAWPAAAYP